MIGWPLSRSCAVACLFGDESQQPIFPHVMHMRRWTHCPPVFRHSSHPWMVSGTSLTWIWSRCVHTVVFMRSTLDRGRTDVGGSGRAQLPGSRGDTELSEAPKNERGGHRALADRASDPLRGAMAHIARREQPRAARLQRERIALQRPALRQLVLVHEVAPGDDVALLAGEDVLALAPLGVRHAADAEEDAVGLRPL